ncbi:MAG: hypothetical protein VX252_06800 [Myxococcota bacterium]|nr:hypothetical protein [Myxococcota bacterium]
MLIALRILSGLAALMFLWNGILWIFSPADVAESLGMPLLEGVGASTQIGDLGSFFLVSGIMMVLGQIPGKSVWLYPPAMLIFGAAVIRTLASLLGNASFAFDFIGLEIIMSAILAFTASKLAETS